VEADEDTGNEARDGDAGKGPDAGGAVKPRRRTRWAVGKQSASAVAAAVSAVKVAEKKKKRKRKATSPQVVVTPTISTPRSREVESKEEEEEEEEKEKDEAIEELPVTEDRPTRRSESPAAKGEQSWWKRRRRMPSGGVWRCNGLLLPRRKRCLQRLDLGSLGRNFGFRFLRGKILKTQSFLLDEFLY
jgi:hypothetical protein